MSADPRNAQEAQGAGPQQVQDLWASARLHPSICNVSDLLQGNGLAGRDPWRRQVELVES
jgi:hypothetical protein